MANSMHTGIRDGSQRRGRDEQTGEPLFRFLTASNLLKIERIVPRQRLPAPLKPVPRDFMKDICDDNLSAPPFESRSHVQVVSTPETTSTPPALGYVFISHRWMHKTNPDESGEQLKALKLWFRYVEELLNAVLPIPKHAKGKTGSKTGLPLDWAVELTDLLEGMPEAASFVSRIVDKLKQSTSEKSIDGAQPQAGSSSLWKLLQSPNFEPLDHVYVWYDCLCLPQKFGDPQGRTPKQKLEFTKALQNLDLLAEKCEVLCLVSNDYFNRAWCAVEHFQKSLNFYQGQLMLRCDSLGKCVVWVANQTTNPEEEPKSAVQVAVQGGDVTGKVEVPPVLRLRPRQRLVQPLSLQLRQNSQRHSVPLQNQPRHVQPLRLQLRQNPQRHSVPLPNQPRPVKQTRLQARQNPHRQSLPLQDQPRRVQRLQLQLRQNPQLQSLQVQNPQRRSLRPPQLPHQATNVELATLIKAEHQATVTKLRHVMNRSQQVEYETQQTNWTLMLQDLGRRTPETSDSAFCEAEKDVLHHNPQDIAVVPDLALGHTRILFNNQSASPQSVSPLFKALTQLVRELFTAVFCLSCRDAAEFAGEGQESVQCNLNQCPQDVGIQCGLHDHTRAQSIGKQREALQAGLDKPWTEICLENPLASDESLKLRCPKGHRLWPTVSSRPNLMCDSDECLAISRSISPQEVHTRCIVCDYDVCFYCATSRADKEKKNAPSSQAHWDELMRASGISIPTAKTHPKERGRNKEPLCERRVTLDLYHVTHSILTKFNLKCTNGSDAAFVGLQALRNILYQSTRQEYETGESQQMVKKEEKKGLKVAAGSLLYLSGAIEEAVVLYSKMLANDQKVESLKCTVTIRVPRWVLLDMLSSQLDDSSNLAMAGQFNVESRRVRDYFRKHPHCFSWKFQTSAKPLKHSFCQDDAGCVAGWSPCRHRRKLSLETTAMHAAAPSGRTLDPWTTTKFPITLAGFSCECVGDRIHVIGGANGDSDPNTSTFTTTLTHVFSARIPLSTRTRWLRQGDLLVARRNHSSCLLHDPRTKQPVAILTSGGLAAGRDASIVNTIESMDLAFNQSESILYMPRPRFSHHMACVRNCLFLFGGRTNPTVDSPDSQTCDIYDFGTREWLEGPVHPVAFRAGNSILLHGRFVWVFGGMTGSSDLEESWILDLKPWLAWIAGDGGGEHKRPSTAWVAGPSLPRGMAFPNICLALRQETGLADDWILAVGASWCAFCFGMKLPPANEFDDQTTTPWYEKRLSWIKLGITPDSCAGGSAFVAKGMLGIICGLSLSHGGAVSDKVHFRALPSSGDILPRERPLDTGIDGLEYALGNGTRVSTILQTMLNNRYMVGRLGFPLEEATLFTNEGVRRLSVVAAKNLSCVRCLYQSMSLEQSKAHSDAALFEVRTAPLAGESPRSTILCSECLCEMYYHQATSL